MRKKKIRQNGCVEGEDAITRAADVGAKPREGEVIPGHIPRGLEVLIKKAAVDPAFKNILSEKRAEAAKAIGLKLTAAEEAMLAAVPLPQLEGIVAHTRISPKLRPAFLGYAAGAMLAALGGTLLISDLLDRGSNTDTKNVVLGKKRGVRVRPSLTAKSKIVCEQNSVRSNAEYGYRYGLGGSGGIRPGGLSQKNTKTVRVSVPSPAALSGMAAADANRTPRAIASVIRRHLPGIEHAYNSALKKNPNLDSGKITLKFTITAAGEVTSPEIVRDTLGAPGLSGNILSRIRTWRFPPAGAGDVTVIYPFIFDAGGI